MEKILEPQLLIRGRAFATFSTFEKARVVRKKSFRGAHSAAGRMLCRPAQADQLANCFERACR